MARIAVDIDSTLYDFETICREGFLKLAQDRDDPSLKRGAYHPWTEWRSPTDACGVQPFLDVLDLCHDNETISNQVPFPGSVETCRALAEEGHQLLYISNRRVESTDATRKWLQRYGFPLAGTACPYDTNGDGDCGRLLCPHCGKRAHEHELICMMDEKREHIADCQYIIDDRPRTVIDFVYDFEWTQAILKKASWIRDAGPEPDDSGFHEVEPYRLQWQEAHDAGKDTSVQLKQYSVATAEAAEKYVSENCRRAFVLAYPYNQNLTDIPHLYLAPTWAGLNDYLVSKGVLSKPAHLALT